MKTLHLQALDNSARAKNVTENVLIKYIRKKLLGASHENLYSQNMIYRNAELNYFDLIQRLQINHFNLVRPDKRNNNLHFPYYNIYCKHQLARKEQFLLFDRNKNK